MLKNNIFRFGNIRHKHLGRHPAFVIHGKAHAITLRPLNPPVTEPALRVIDVRHDLAAAAVAFAAPMVVQFTHDTVQPAADCFLVLPRDQTLLLPEIPIPIAFVVFDMQEFVRRNPFSAKASFLRRRYSLNCIPDISLNFLVVWNSE